MFQFRLNLIPSDQSSRLNLISSDLNSCQITMTTTSPNPKRVGTNVITDEVYVGGASLKLQYGISINPSYCHTRQIRSSKMMQEP